MNNSVVVAVVVLLIVASVYRLLLAAAAAAKTAAAAAFFWALVEPALTCMLLCLEVELGFGVGAVCCFYCASCTKFKSCSTWREF